MKYYVLKQKLIKNVAILIRQGGKHEIWKGANGVCRSVPRHKDLNENTVKSILKAFNIL